MYKEDAIHAIVIYAVWHLTQFEKPARNAGRCSKIGNPGGFQILRV